MALVAICGAADPFTELDEVTYAGLREAQCPRCSEAHHRCVCSGADRYLQGSQGYVRALDKRVIDAVNLFLSRPPCRHRAIEDSERHAFDYFRHWTLFSLIKQSPTGGGWFRHAMVLSDAENCVFQAITAVAAAHKSLTEVVHTSLARSVDAASTELALQHYSKAIMLLRERIHSFIERRESLEPILLTCLLLMIFEIYQGRHSNGAQHVRFAKRIVHENLLNDRDRLGETTAIAVKTISIATSGPLGSIYTTSFPMLSGKLGSSTASSGEFAGLATELELLIGTSSSMCMDLRHLAAKNVRLASGFTLRDIAYQTCLEHALSRQVNLIQHIRIQNKIQDLLSKLTAWRDEVDQLLETREIELSQGLILLKIRHFTTFFALATCQDRRECNSDRFEASFLNTLHLIEIYLCHREDTGYLGPVRPWVDKSSHRAVITEIGVLPALLVICSKCRTSKIRRRALDVLIQSKRIESEHSSGLLADFAKAIIDLEETRARELTSPAIASRELYANEVPEQARFSDVVIAPVQGRSEMFRLVCARFAHELDGSVDVVECENLHKYGNTILLL